MARKSRSKTTPSSSPAPAPAPAAESSILSARRRDIILALLLIALGLTQSILLWQHAPMPHPDSPYFIRTARELIRLETPTTFKRAPVTGFLQLALTPFIRDMHPDLTAGWLLNAILNPFNILLYWLIGRHFLGRFAFPFAVLMSFNPWTLLRLTEGIAETPLLFFMLLTIYLILRRTPWAYVAAAFACLVRYEAAALIPIALLLDMIAPPGKHKRLHNLAYAALACVPLGFWMLGTFLTWDPQASHYIHHYGRSSNTYALSRYLPIIWRTSVAPLLGHAPEKFATSPFQFLWPLSKVLAFVLPLVAVVYSLIKRRWIILVPAVFILLYLAIHIGRNSAKDRYYAPVAWIVILLSAVGVQGLWQLLQPQRWPRALIIGLQVIVTLIAVFVTIPIIRQYPDIHKFSPVARPFPYLALAALLIYLILHLLHDPRRVLAVFALVAVSSALACTNQFTLVVNLGSGQRDIEFKYLVDWFAAHAEPDAKIAVTLPTPMRTLAPRFKKQFVHTGYIDADSPQQFTRACLEENITYVTWDGRIGFARNNSYYRRWNIDNVAMLFRPYTSVLVVDPQPAGSPLPVGFYEFIATIDPDGTTHPPRFYQYVFSQGVPRRYINVFRLHPPDPAIVRGDEHPLYIYPPQNNTSTP